VGFPLERELVYVWKECIRIHFIVNPMENNKTMGVISKVHFRLE